MLILTPWQGGLRRTAFQPLKRYDKSDTKVGLEMLAKTSYHKNTN